MKIRTQLFTLAMILLSCSYSFSQTAYSFSEGISASKSSGKMIFLNIYSPADSWSKKMDSEVYSSDKVKSALSGFVFVKLNADGNEKYSYNGKEYSSKNLAGFFGGTGYPTFVMMNSDGSIISFKYNGEKVTNVSGFIGDTDLAEMLNYFSNGSYKTTDLSTVFQN